MAACNSSMVSLYEEGPDPRPDEQPDRVVVLIGRTGAGKSTMANVLAGKESLFNESSGAMSCTKETPTELVAVNFGSTHYVLKIVDTIGIGDTKLKPVDVLNQLAHIANNCTGGINQVLFVTSSRFTKEEEEAFDMMKSVIFQTEVLNYTSVIRTYCVEYDEPEEEVRVRTDLQQQSPIMKHVKKFLLVSNPSLKKERGRELAMEDRCQSRQRVLAHLILNCKERYSPDTLQRIQERVKDKIDEEKKLEQELNATKKELASVQQTMDTLKQNEETQRQTMEAEKAEINGKLKEVTEQAAAMKISSDEVERQNKMYLERLAAMDEAERKRENGELREQLRIQQQQLLTQQQQQNENKQVIKEQIAQTMGASHRDEKEKLNALVQQLEREKMELKMARQVDQAEKTCLEVKVQAHEKEVEAFKLSIAQLEGYRQRSWLGKYSKDL
ncbi:trichohyalin-like [Sycon ciliatum]|uniref:trichohyalin-like n=1 Tax=Sycon ciliatum TaxID=27933 RepID=UPI0031F6594D